MAENKNILITGASGFVGSHLVKAALEKGYYVYALVRKTSQYEVLDEVNYLTADLSNYDKLVEALKKSDLQSKGLHHVIHAAAITKALTPKAFETANVEGTKNLYNALDELSIVPNKIVFISSLAACGPVCAGEQVIFSQEAPITSYGKSKLAAEKFILSTGQTNTVIIRPTAVYGPRETEFYTVFKMIQKGLNPSLGRNQQVLTFIYVDDLVQIIFSALNTDAARKIYFATDGREYTKYDFSNAIKKALNKKTLNLTVPTGALRVVASVNHFFAGITGKISSLNPEKYHELTAESWSCDVKPAFDDLQYQPKYNVEEGVKKTVEWYQKNNWL